MEFVLKLGGSTRKVVGNEFKLAQLGFSSTTDNNKVW